MSSASALPVVLSPPPPPPPPAGLNYVATLDPSITFLLIGTAFSAMLIPIAVILFFFSNSAIRRQPVFLLNVFILALGLAEGAINIYNQTRFMLAKPVPVGFSIAFACFAVLVPMLADTVLLLRVVTVYPPSHLRASCIAGVYGPIAAIKIARMIVELVFVVEWTRAITRHGHDNLFVAGQEAWNTPYPKAAWVVQLVDSTYTSAIFLLRLKSGTFNSRRFRVPGASNDTDLSGTTQNSYYDRLKTLFWISASNFVFPVILDIALLILAFRDASFLTGAYVLMVSNYVEIVGVLLATIWSTSTKYPRPHGSSGDAGADFRATRSLSSPRFAIAVVTTSVVDEALDERDSMNIPMAVFKQGPSDAAADAAADTRV